MLGRVLLVSALVLAAPAPVGSAPSTPPAPGWSLHYFFGTILYGGTTFDVDASGRFDLVATSAFPNRSPRSERLGTLSAAQADTLARLVATARPSTWSSRYSGRGCAEHYPSLSLTRAQAIPERTVKVSWTCGLLGVPADLRALILALRAQITALLPDAMIDASPTAEAIPVSTHAAMTLVSLDRRSVSIAADGTIVERRRAAVALYPVADCPQRELGSVDAVMLPKLHALQTPTADVFFGTSRETAEIFASAMDDCPFPPGYGYAAPEYLVPAGTRWVLQVTRAAGNANVVSLAVDNAGRTLVRRKDGDAERGTIAAGTLAALDRLIANAHDDHWPRTFDVAGGCEQIVQITHIGADGARTNGPAIDGGCDAGGAPADAAALFRYAGARLIPELTRPR